MRIGVVADTHMPRSSLHLPQALREGLEGVDLIIHAGDWVTLQVAEERIAPTVGVYGNNDREDIRTHYPASQILQLDGFQIGVVHGDGVGGTTLKRAIKAFETRKLDVVIFGHSHIPFHEEIGGVLYFNPGSPTDKRRQPLYSYGIIETGQKLIASHITYPSKE